jgi:transposase
MSEGVVPKVAPIELTESDRERLKGIIRKGWDWRERNRAETVLLLAEGHPVQFVAESQGLCREAVRIRRRKWLKQGLASLPDQPRCGAPSKLAEDHRQSISRWVEDDALSSREILTRLHHEYGVVISPTTLRMELKRLGFVWKRTRYRLKKNATPSGSSRPESTLRR